MLRGENQVVEIGRKTGCRWRAENGGVPPDRVEAQRSNRYLSRLERQRIATLRGQGLAFGRSPVVWIARPRRSVERLAQQ